MEPRVCIYQNKAIVQRLLEQVWNEQRLDGLHELVVRDYVDDAARC
jgi:hypothetical protein